jgi:Gametolysin peptidase M11
MLSLLIFCFSAAISSNTNLNIREKTTIKEFTGEISVISIDSNNTGSISFILNQTYFLLNIKEDATRYLENAFVKIFGTQSSSNTIYVYNYTVLNRISHSLKNPLSSPSSIEKKVGIFYMNLSGNSCGTTSFKETCNHCITNLDQIRDTFYRDSSNNVKDFYKEVSDGNVDLIIDSSSIFNVDITSSPSDLYNSIDSMVKSKIGIDPLNYDLQVFIFPTNWRRVYPLSIRGVIGIGEVGGERTWMLSCKMDLFTHELGHNFGFGHSNAFDKSGNVLEYYDESSVMSFSTGLSKRGINSAHRESAGWLKNSQIIKVDVNSLGFWKIKPLNELTAKKLILLNYKSINYFIEFRQKVSYDSDIDSGFSDSVLIRTMDVKKHTYIISALSLNEELIIDNDLIIAHSIVLGNVSITKNSTVDSSCNLLQPYYYMIFITMVLFMI